MRVNCARATVQPLQKAPREKEKQQVSTKADKAKQGNGKKGKGKRYGKRTHSIVTRGHSRCSVA